MSDQWRAAATRGQLDLDVITAARAKADFWAIDEDAVALCVLYPHGEAPLPVRFRTLARVKEFCEEMRPGIVRCFGTEEEGEAVAKLQAELIGAHVPGEAQLH